MSKSKSQRISDKAMDLLAGGTFGAVIIYSCVACLQVLTISVGV